MSAACQQVNQLLAALPPHSFDLKQVSGWQKIHSPLDKGHRGMVACETKGQTEKKARSPGVYGLRIGAIITGEREHEAFDKPPLILSLRGSKIMPET